MIDRRWQATPVLDLEFGDIIDTPAGLARVRGWVWTPERLLLVQVMPLAAGSGRILRFADADFVLRRK